MDCLRDQERTLRVSINKWFKSEYRDKVVADKSCLWKSPTQQLNYLTSLFLNFGQESESSSLKSESLFLVTIFTTSRHQIRSFIYVSTLKKLLQTLKKIDGLKIAETYSKVAISACSIDKLISLQSLHSLEWRLIALIELLVETRKNAANLVELLTEEMTSSLFLHYPIAFTSMGPSLAEISDYYARKGFNLQCKMLSMEKIKQSIFKKC